MATILYPEAMLANCLSIPSRKAEPHHDRGRDLTPGHPMTNDTSLALASISSFEILGVLRSHYIERLRRDHTQPAQHLGFGRQNLLGGIQCNPACWASPTMLNRIIRSLQYHGVDIAVTRCPILYSIVLQASVLGQTYPLQGERPGPLCEAISYLDIGAVDGQVQGHVEVPFLQSNRLLYIATWHTR